MSRQRFSFFLFLSFLQAGFLSSHIPPFNPTLQQQRSKIRRWWTYQLKNCIVAPLHLRHSIHVAWDVGGKAGMSRRARESHENRELKITFEKDNCIEIYCFLFGPHASFRRNAILFPFSSLNSFYYNYKVKNFFSRANLEGFKFYK